MLTVLPKLPVQILSLSHCLGYTVLGHSGNAAYIGGTGKPTRIRRARAAKEDIVQNPNQKGDHWIGAVIMVGPSTRLALRKRALGTADWLKHGRIAFAERSILQANCRACLRYGDPV